MLKSRPLVDIAVAVSSALLMNELQWLGLVVKPINYSLKGALLSIDTGPGLMIDESNMVQINNYAKSRDGEFNVVDSDTTTQNTSTEDFNQLVLENGKIALPDWASDKTTILWFPVRAMDDRIARGASAGLMTIYHK